MDLKHYISLKDLYSLNTESTHTIRNTLENNLSCVKSVANKKMVLGYLFVKPVDLIKIKILAPLAHRPEEMLVFVNYPQITNIGRLNRSQASRVILSREASVTGYFISLNLQYVNNIQIVISANRNKEPRCLIRKIEFIGNPWKSINECCSASENKISEDLKTLKLQDEITQLKEQNIEIYRKLVETEKELSECQATNKELMQKLMETNKLSDKKRIQKRNTKVDSESSESSEDIDHPDDKETYDELVLGTTRAAGVEKFIISFLKSTERSYRITQLAKIVSQHYKTKKDNYLKLQVNDIKSVIIKLNKEGKISLKKKKYLF